MPARTEQTANSIYRACGLVEGLLEPETDDPETEILAAWQHLIDTGVAWQLQGRIGRQAMDLITAGECSPPPGFALSRGAR